MENKFIRTATIIFTSFGIWIGNLSLPAYGTRDPLLEDRSWAGRMNQSLPQLAEVNEQQRNTCVRLYKQNKMAAHTMVFVTGLAMCVGGIAESPMHLLGVYQLAGLVTGAVGGMALQAKLGPRQDEETINCAGACLSVMTFISGFMFYSARTGFGSN